MNLWDILILFAVAAGLFCAVRKVRKNRRSGGCGCGCEGCLGCPDMKTDTKKR